MHDYGIQSSYLPYAKGPKIARTSWVGDLMKIPWFIKFARLPWNNTPLDPAFLPTSAVQKISDFWTVRVEFLVT
jgi:hypothetical protein